MKLDALIEKYERIMEEVEDDFRMVSPFSVTGRMTHEKLRFISELINDLNMENTCSCEMVMADK